MRFRFCGDLDCPDWVLAEISLLSRMTSVKMKLLCIQVLNYLLGNQMDYEKVKKLTSDAKYDSSDVKACLAALSFILSSSAKYSTDDETLANELQQLGLPKEHSVSLCKAYADRYNALQDHLKEESLKLSHLDQVKWRVDYLLASNFLDDINEPTATINLHKRDSSKSGTDQEITEHAVTMTSSKLSTLLYELKDVMRKMESLS